MNLARPAAGRGDDGARRGAAGVARGHGSRAVAGGKATSAGPAGTASHRAWLWQRSRQPIPICLRDRGVHAVAAADARHRGLLGRTVAQPGFQAQPQHV